MPRKPMEKKYSDFIERGVHAGDSNYTIEREMASEFPAERTKSEYAIRRHRQRYEAQVKSAKEKAEALIAHSDMDKPWMSTRFDKKDDIPTEVSDYISTFILSNDKIMRADVPLDPVTRRTSMWIATLFDRLRGEKPLFVWSAARMYSQQESLSEYQQVEFDTRQFDVYLAMRPWASFEESQRYDNAVKDGWLIHIREVSDFGYIHWDEILELRTVNFLKTTSRSQQDRPSAASMNQLMEGE